MNERLTSKEDTRITNTSFLIAYHHQINLPTSI